MDKYFPDDDEAEVEGAQVDETGAFNFQNNVAAPSGGFSFGQAS
jgi:importin subunit alpha-1